ncbi:MAG: hypothetical protein IT553_05820 [Sphingomonadaceae bacterium]|nr:hypothetical protein [Sphingomonadaceae bacterium]
MRQHIHSWTRRGGIGWQLAEQTLINIVIQALGAITTLSFVHLLTVPAYATFGLAVTTVGFVSVASDLGLGASVSYFWRAATKGEEDFAHHYAAALYLRRFLFVIAAAVATLILCWLEYRAGKGAGQLLLLSLLTIALGWLQLNAQMAVQPIRLSGALRTANLNEFWGALLRALLAILAFVLVWREAWFPLISLGLGALATWILAERGRPDVLREPVQPTPANKRAVLSYITPTIPNSLVFATQGLLPLWLASLAGGAVVVAQTFALGRLAAIFVMINALMTNVIIPRIVNLRDDGHALRNGLVPVAAVALFCGGLLGVAAIFPRPFLYLLGGNYAGLHGELLLCLAAVSLQTLSTMVGQVTRAMGWVRFETWVMGAHVLVIAGAVWLFDFTTSASVLGFTLVLALANFLEMLAILAIGAAGIDSRPRTMRRASTAQEGEDGF